MPGFLAPKRAELLVGRANALAAIQQHLVSDDTPLLLLAGEPGIGKTRLLREAVSRATAMGQLVLGGGCHRGGDSDPFTPMLQAVQTYLRYETSATLEPLLNGCAWLAQLMPELSDVLVQPPTADQLPPNQVRRLMFGALMRLLSNASGDRGVVLVLDDLQWASRDGLDLLAFVVRNADQVGIHAVCAYRDTESDQGPLPEVIADLSRLGLVTQHQLGPVA